MIEDPTVSKIVDAALVGATTLITWSIMRSKERVDKIMTRLALVESEKITGDEAREIMSTELSEIKDTLHKIADTVVQIRIDQAKKGDS